MRSKLLSFAITILSAPALFGQYNLTYTNDYGNIPPGYNTTDLITTGTVIHNGSLAANAWSAQQTLPFSFTFYGTPVSTYYVSANGVVTFDVTTPSILPGSNTTLPTAALPAMSIAGLWDDFTNAPPTGSNDVVRVNIFGTAPNRQLWISWYSFETGNPNLSFAYWSIVLEETTNNIYITDQYSNTGSSTGCTVGLQQNSTTAISDANSPNIVAPGNGTSLTDNDVWFFQYLGAPCSGMPATGTTAGPTPTCPATVNIYTVTGATIASGIAYQWQSSPDNITWSDIVGATTGTYTAAIPTNIFLRRRDVCTNTSDTAFSNSLAVTVSPFIDCYCTTMPTQTADEEIYTVVMNGDSTPAAYAGTNGCSTPAPGPGSILSRYSNFKTLAPLTTLGINQSIPFSIDQNECDGPTYYFNGIAIWIDYNHNGSFADPGEQVFVEAFTAQGPRTVTGSFIVPSTAQTGITAMRIICAEGYSGSSLTPCMNYSYGETEDYLVDIQCIASTSTDVVTTCDSLVWIDGNTYTANNSTATYTIVGGASTGCDSIVTLNLTVNYTAAGTDVLTSCGPYTWIDGNTYSASNSTATHILSGAAVNGCDSVVTLNLTVNSPAAGIDTQVACDSYTWIDSVTYTSSNNTATYTYTNGAANGCDSTVTLNLTINTPSYATDVQTACGSFIWIDSVLYISSNSVATYTMIGGAANGCDSVITLNLTINNPSTGIDSLTACDSYVWIDGNTYTSSNNSATHTITGGAANGCDSTVTLNLTINTVDNTVSVAGATLTANQAGGTYQWLDCDNSNAPIAGATGQSFTATASGNYAVQVTANGCTEVSACSFVSTIGINEEYTLDFKLYPNPTENQFVIDFGSEVERYTINLYSIDGRLIQQHTSMTGKTFHLSLEQHPAATYLLQVVTPSGVSSMIRISKI